MKKQKINIHKKLANGNEVLDFAKIEALGCPYNLLITQRGEEGKTFNGKDYLLDMYNKKGDKGIWLMNTNTQCNKDSLKFLTNNVKVDGTKWEGVERKGVENAYRFEKNGDTFIELVGLNTSEYSKGSRDSSIKRIFYDEFNVGLRAIGNKQTHLFNTLLNTYNDIQNKNKDKLTTFIFGNFKSLATPLLIDMKIFKIDKEHTFIKDSQGKPFIYIYCPKPKGKVVEEKYKGDPIYEFAKLTGEADHNFLNQSAYDIINGIIPFDERSWRYVITYFIDNRLYNVYQQGYNYGVKLFDKGTMEKGKDIVTLKANEVQTGYIYGGHQAKQFVLELIKTRKIQFNCQSCHIAFTKYL